MSASFIHSARRMNALQPYFFSRLGQQINELKRSGQEVIRLDMGAPDMPPPPFLREILSRAVLRPDAHSYAPYGGTADFRRALADYYRRRFAVELDPQNEVIGLIGSKEGLFNLSQALLDPGDVVLVPDPGYPIYAIGAQLAGAEVHYLPLRRENGWLPDLEAVEPGVLRRARLLWLNYPNNPTGACAAPEFFEQAVAFARQNEIVIAHDSAYCDITFDGERPGSLLAVPGASEVSIEFNSFSKTYHLAGWRVGMAAGSPELIAILSNYKTQVDSASFIPFYEAAAAAIYGDQGWLEERNAIYRQRRNLIVNTLQELGFDCPAPRASLYVWARLPQAWGERSAEFCQRLLHEAGVSLTPGEVYGNCGLGYVRISLGAPTDQVERAMQKLKQWAAG